jgi:ornithine cyclodeaminase
MRLIAAEEIRSRLDIRDLIEPVSQAFRDYSRGRSSDAMAHLFPSGGEVHIKAGASSASKVFAVKVSCGFPANESIGLPVWDGAVLALDATTGQPRALIQDGGLLTDWRTAIAGAIATRACAQRKIRRLGIVGTGLQGFWQPIAHRALIDYEYLAIWGRDPSKAGALRTNLQSHLPGVSLEVTPSLETLFLNCDAIITVTASTTPLIRASWVQPGHHITAVGADTDAKQELEHDVLAGAGLIVVDSLPANEKYGDVGRAIRAGAVRRERLLELGTVLDSPPHLSPGDFSIAKLVGLGVQDLAAVNAVMERFPAESHR